ARFLRIVSGEEAGVDYDAPYDPRQPEPNDRPVVPRVASAARLPSVHPFSALCVHALAPLGLRGLEHGFLGCEELVVCGQHGATKAFRGEVREMCEHVGVVGGVYHTRAKTHRPPTYVSWTTPYKSRPAYGVRACRWRKAAGSTRNRSSGFHTTRSASRPAAIVPLRPASPANAAVRSHIQLATRESGIPRSRAPVQTAANES